MTTASAIFGGLLAPFPYFGGKRTVAADVYEPTLEALLTPEDGCP